jgi:VIT1/CCC1 family predicted Fe2+/Mn2+ transporter/rubrerythrin
MQTEETDQKTAAEWMHHYQDEFDAAFLYRVLTEVEPDPKRKDIFRRLADVEDRHTEMWIDIMKRHGITPPTGTRPSRRARFLAWVGRKFSPATLVNLLLREEGQEVKGYLKLHEESESKIAKDAALTLATESAGHVEDLQGLSPQEEGIGEPWHRTTSGGFLGNVIYGFNDGLTANFGLVAGVIGAVSTSQLHTVLVAGIAGAVADALSMASSGYLAAKSEQEVYEHEIRVEKQEIELMPEAEQEELALIYEMKGIRKEQAEQMAADVMESPERALEEKVREELKIGEAHATPFREGWITGVATAIGAFIPVFPFLLFHGRVAVWVAFAIAMLSHFGVGAARSLFTGRGIIRSGFDMFVVGLGVAVIGYFVGGMIQRFL